MDVKIIKILAYGSNRRFVWFTINNEIIKCFRISNDLYVYLKNHGVSTCQSLRSKKWL